MIERVPIPGIALVFVVVLCRSPESQVPRILAADWQDSTSLVPAPQHWPDAIVPGALGAPALPYRPADYFRDASLWRPLPMVPPGSAHARRVWGALNAIPVGTTRTYGELARELGSSPRAVGQACRTNPWPVFIPCHRVVPVGWTTDIDAVGAGAQGAGVGGYSGARSGPLTAIKSWLLRHERLPVHEKG